MTPRLLTAMLGIAALCGVLELTRLSARAQAPQNVHEPAGDVKLPPPRTAEIGAPSATPPLVGMCLAEAIKRSLANVQTVKANVAMQSAGVARFEALKEFVPLVNLPQTMVGLRQLSPGNLNVFFPDVLGYTNMAGTLSPDYLGASRMNLFFPMDPSGQITALPIAEEGVRAKLLMEQMVRRSQVMLAIQGYFEAKQLHYGIRVAKFGVTFAEENHQLFERKRLQKQANDIEVSQARVEEGKARVLLADLEKSSRVAERKLAVVVHQSLLLLPQDFGPRTIDVEQEYGFDLNDPEAADVASVPDFPASRDEAIQLAKRQRLEVRLLVVGLRIARLQRQRSLIGLLGFGRLPMELSMKNGLPTPRGVSLGAIFGTTYNLPILDIGLWANIRRARLDVIQSQLDLEKALLDVASDAGNSWDRWQQAVKEWQQKEAELGLRREMLQRLERLYHQKQAILVEVLGAQVNFLQADANRWSAWLNLQLAAFDVLRSTEQLLDYVQRSGIADLSAGQEAPAANRLHHSFSWLPWPK